MKEWTQACKWVNMNKLMKKRRKTRRTSKAKNQRKPRSINTKVKRDAPVKTEAEAEVIVAVGAPDEIKINIEAEVEVSIKRNTKKIENTEDEKSHRNKNSKWPTFF